ncbi:MAG: hypothetical protein WBP13_07015 [Methylophilaceae bacterium]
MQPPKLRDNKNRKGNEPYQIGDIPNEVILNVGKWLIYNLAVGKADIDGEDWGDIFAKAIDGEHLYSPVGLADVVLDGMAWSVKSLKNNKPHTCKNVRVISGRNSPDYSYNISDPHADIAKTGQAVLSIWNERISVATDSYQPLRSSVLIRNPDLLQYTLFEQVVERFPTNNYQWKVNKNGNLEGFDINTGKHKFTWQPHGAQFTIIYDVPKQAKKFTLKRPQTLDFQQTMAQIGFEDSWVSIHE